MSEINLDWLSRVSQEDSEKANIKPEGINPKTETEAVNVVGGDEKLTNEGKSAGNHEVNLKDDTVPDDNAAAADAEGEIGVKVSNESATGPDIKIDLTPSTEDSEEDEQAKAEAEAAAAAAGTEGEPPVVPVEPEGEPGVEPVVPAALGDEPGTAPVGEVVPPIEPTEPVAELEPAAGDVPVEPVVPVEGEAPVEPIVPVDGEPVVVPEGIAPVLPAEGAPVEPVAPAATDPAPGVVNTEIGTEPTEPMSSPETGIKEGAEPEVPVAIDPVIEIKEGTDAAVADAVANPEVDGGPVDQSLTAPAPNDQPAPPVDNEQVMPIEQPDSMAPVEPTEPVVPAVDDTPVEPVVPAEGEAPVEPVVPVEPVEEEEEEVPAEEDFDAHADDSFFNEFLETEEDTGDLTAMQTALEGYTEILNSVSRRGDVVSPQLAQSIRIGLQAFRGEGLDQGIPSMEDFEDPVGAMTVSNELAEDIKNKAGQVGAAVMAAIRRLLETLGDAFAQVKHNVPQLVQANVALAARVAKLQGSKVSGKISVKGAERLFVGGNFGGDTQLNYNYLATFSTKFLVDYPNALAAVMTKFQTGEQKDVAALAVAIGNGFLPNQWGLLGIDAAKAPEQFSKYDSVFASQTLIGNGRIYAGNRAPNGNLTSISDVWAIAFVKSDVSIDASATEVNLPDATNLKLIVASLGNLIDKVPQLADMQRGGFKRAQDGVSKALGAEGLGDAGAGLVRSLTVPTGSLVGHVVNTIKVAQAFVDHCIKQHEAGGQA